MIDQPWDDVIARYPARLQPQSPPVCLGGGGGLSGATLWRFRADAGDFVLRAWPPHGSGRAHVEQIHRWLLSAAELGFIPVPVRDRAGETLQELRGVLWELTPWLAGAPDLSHPPDSRHVRLALTGLAAFHQRLAVEQVEAVSPGLRQRKEEIDQLIHGGFRALEAAIHRGSDGRAHDDRAALDWLSLARKVAPRVLEPLGRASKRVIRLQPTARDARPEHFLFDGDRLSALVDFGAMGVDSVAGDLARLIGDWFDCDVLARREALETYERIRPLDPAETELIGIFEATTALLIGERWVRWHYVEDRRFDDPRAVARGLERGVQQLERLADTLIRP